jgi:hypothetical protein
MFVLRLSLARLTPCPAGPAISHGKTRLPKFGSKLATTYSIFIYIYVCVCACVYIYNFERQSKANLVVFGSSHDHGDERE